MRDLLVYVADADAFGFMRAVLKRHQALRIRKITFEVERHPLRDSGMIQSGPELTRMKKGQYAKALLMWDHHGSGRERYPASEAMKMLQERLDSFTWRDNSAVQALQPELEEWLWFCEDAVAAHLGVAASDLERWAQHCATDLSLPDLKVTDPKALFEYVMRERLKRTISPRDFEEISRLAGIDKLEASPSFKAIVQKLREWFPPA